MLVGLLAGTLPAIAQNETRYVSDQFEINLRTGKSTEHAILRVLPTGMPLEVLESDAQAGYTRVRTSRGDEGWVLSRYLMAQPPARERIEAVRERMEAAEEELRQQGQTLAQLERERSEVDQRAASVQQDNDRLAQELNDVRRASANVLAIGERNSTLQQRVAVLESELAAVKLANEELADRSARDWFVAGAGVVLLGMMLGLILPRLHWRRKSRYSDF
ncbi:MAG: TIGR04211 family SH3 domain-containing protein [Gammaproteobacteria bacterium]|nr:TIGR04211 family SH3 domain-containing protein [Gammaproteobacteria bacterium]